MTRKKILFVIENSSYGGGEKTFSVLIKGLPREIFEVYCAALPRGRFYEEVRAHCRFLPFDLSDRFAPANVTRLAALMREHGITLAHSQGARADFYCAFAAARAGVPAVSTVAMPVEGFEVGALRKAAYLLLNRLAERKFAAVITVSKFLGDFFVKEHGLPREKVVVIPNPAQIVLHPRLPGGERLVLASAGRLVEQKGFGLLLEALAVLAKEDPAVFSKLDCVVAGEGPLRVELETLARGLGVAKKISFPGFAGDVGELFSRADIFVLPSRAEGQPLVLLEAMAAGLPVIAADLPGVKEVVSDGADARLFPAGNPEALAKAISDLAASADLRAKFGSAAAVTAGKYAPESFVRAHGEFYRRLLAD